VIQPVYMPKLGQTMEEATIERWHKSEGDAVKKGDVILEITTDKATLEVESTVAGVMRKILAPEKIVLAVNTVVALVGAPEDALPDNIAELEAIARGEKKLAAAPAAAAPKSAAPATASARTPQAAAPAQPVAVAPAAPVAQPSGRIIVSPRARKLAKDEKVPLAILPGSGPNGRIIEKDVTAYLARRDQVRPTGTAIAVAFERGIDLSTLKGTGPGGRVTKEDVLSAPVAGAPAVRGKRVELSAMRRVVAQRMTQSKREAPHFYLMMDIDMTAAAAFRKKLNDAATQRIAFHDLVIRACAKAFQENPAMNMVWGGDCLIQRDEINVSLAVALDEGLIVPVVKDADQLDLAGTAKASARLIERARSKKLTPDEYEGGCLTLSNLGMFDVENFIPVINPGESAILGMGRIAPKPVVIDGAVCIRSMMACTLSGDHRAVDGAIAAKFLKCVKDLLEAPEQLA
jgi:pyruvate dehydrogenase E2 component (dihydrolipoamide acetyltransferase)